ncbi:MAG: winged helix-turn-helix domain-containing protein [bacterium]
MTIQQAAFRILHERSRPMSAKEIAQTVLDRKWKKSDSRDPVTSLAQALEKNIRGGVYNDPELVFIRGERGRRIGLPAWKDVRTVPAPDTSSTREIRLYIPETLHDKLHLAAQAKIASSFEETVIVVLQKGLNALSAQIKQGVAKQLDQLDELCSL